tara:strand:+ start:3412 stop:4266 length:855 start_codon:yes stop_codon:yes gene_type:complete
MLKSKIIIGSAQFGLNYGISNVIGKTPINEVDKILSLAKKASIEFIDTSPNYGNSEITLGKLKNYNFKLISKFIANDKDELNKSLLKSLNDLKSKKLYAFLAHRPENVLKNKILWSYLNEIKNSGKVSKIGFSYNNVEEINYCIKLNMIPDIIQIPFNIFDSRFLDLAIYLKNQYNTEIHSRSTFLQGLFFMDPNNLPSSLSLFKNQLIKLSILSKKNILKLSLNYVLNNRNIDKVVIGVENKQQLESLLNSIENSNLDFLKNEFKFNNNEKNLLSPSKWNLIK